LRNVALNQRNCRKRRRKSGIDAIWFFKSKSIFHASNADRPYAKQQLLSACPSGDIYLIIIHIDI
jgi:hypothetical protein